MLVGSKLPRNVTRDVSDLLLRAEGGMDATVRITQLDGTFPDIALARLGACHGARCHEILFSC